MKQTKVLAGILLAVLFNLFLAPAGQAQTYANVTSGEMWIAANVASNLAAGTFTIDARRQDTVAIRANFKLTGAGTDTIGFWFVPSIDGSVSNTVRVPVNYVMVGAANGTTAVNLFTNFSMNGYGYLHLNYVTNGAAAQVLTNLTISYGLKNPSR